MFFLLYTRDGRTTRHQLAPGDTVVGRAPICDLQIDDPSISRRHVRFRVHGDHCVLTDLGGRNGTFVNGEQVTEAELQPGDAVVLGRFPLRLDRAAPDPLVLSDNHSIVRPETLVLRPLDDQPATRAGLAPALSADRLIILLDEISLQLARWHTPADLADRIATVAFNALPIDRVFLLLVDDQTGELQPRVVRTREGRPLRVSLNRTIVRRAMAEGAAVMGADVAFDSHQGADTGHHPAPRAFICAPMRGANGMLGILYVDHHDATALTPGDFEVCLALARHAAAVLDHALTTWRSYAETRLRDRLLLHHPPTVVERLIESARRPGHGREAETREVTLLAAGLAIRHPQATNASAMLQAVTDGFNTLCDAAFLEEGSLVRFDGDVALFIFGLPPATEDHADRGLRAADAMRQGLASLPAGPELLLRIALDTGPAIAGTIHTAGRHAHVVLGDVLRNALTVIGARAESGLILLTSRTRAKLSSIPELQPVGPLGSSQLELFGCRRLAGSPH
ncbi:MAG TPA: FHA domain-containing protein [Vicinamibacterales bacterium]|nr:FHA domain-containing protein [Vicinamibacterales bacterium]